MSVFNHIDEDFEPTEQGRIKRRIEENEKILMWWSFGLLIFVLIAVTVLAFF